MRLSKESQILELNTKQLNRRLENVLDQKLQVLDTLKEEQRRGRERTMTQLVLRTARYHHRLEELQEQELIGRAVKPGRGVLKEDKSVETAKLPPIQQHSSLKTKMYTMLHAKQNFQRHLRLPPL
ncbi:hypothetical protein ACHWQZ_G010040 [Mnemiopsis leidyi]